MPIRISLYEDNTALREALELLLGGFPQFQLVGSYGHCQGVERDVLKDQPDVVLMGGNLRLNTTPGRGTEVRITFPLQGP